VNPGGSAPEEEKRLSWRAWSPCDRERVHFNHGNKNAVCYQPNGSLEYRDRQRPTIAGIRRIVRDGQEGRCARATRNSLDPRTAGASYRIHTNPEIAVYRAGVTGCKGRRGF